MMKMRTLLLVSAVVLLVSPSVASPHHTPNFSRILDLADKYNDTVTRTMQGLFVEDVSQLAEGVNRCEDKFFCKVHTILHKNLGQGEEETALVRNLASVIRSKNLNCTELLKNVTSSTVVKPIPELLRYLKLCIQHRNLNGSG